MFFPRNAANEIKILMFFFPQEIRATMSLNEHHPKLMQCKVKLLCEKGGKKKKKFSPLTFKAILSH